LAELFQAGLEGPTNLSRRPFRQANNLPMQLECPVMQIKREHPNWRAPKIHRAIPLRRRSGAQLSTLRNAV